MTALRLSEVKRRANLDFNLERELQLGWRHLSATRIPEVANQTDEIRYQSKNTDPR
jgi:hypothetical protein